MASIKVVRVTSSSGVGSGEESRGLEERFLDFLGSRRGMVVMIGWGCGSEVC